MPKPAEIAPIVEEAFNRRDREALLALWTDDFAYEGPGVAFAGKERMLAQEENLWRAFPDIRCEVTLFAATQDRAVLVTRMRGVHAGELRMGGGARIAATGRAVDFSLSVHMTFRGDQLAGERLFYDTAGFLRQLGLMEAA